MRILVVEDDLEISRFLKAGLEEQAFAVDVESDGPRALWRARTNEYDLLLLDNILPGKEGRDICRELRVGGKATPIIMLTVQGDLPSKVQVLNSGADDYVVKPFSFEELLARIQAILRRPRAIQGKMLALGDLTMNTETQEVRRGEKQIYLTRKEFQFLEFLLCHAGEVVSRGQILEHVWDAEGDPFSNTIETHILNLRNKIDKGFRQKLIHTVPGRGYKLALLKQKASKKK